MILRHIKISAILLCGFSAWSFGQNVSVSVPGITVSAPKVYDAYYLQKQLDSLKAQLESLQVLNSTTLTGHIGNIQGADLRQVGGSVQAGGPSTPAITTVTGSSPSVTSAGSSLSPSNPTVAATSLSPLANGQSSTDTLNESMQVAAAITNLELLLDGALNDKLDVATGQVRQVYTIGFPITFSAPDPATEKNRRDSVAEVQVSLCTAGNQADIMTLLPQERTYNVAGIVDHSFSASGGGVIAGVVSLGGGFLWSHKRYDIVQQQETIALLREHGLCNGGSKPSTTASFVWQIAPVLGNRYVRSGTQHNIVQFSLSGGTTPGPNAVIAQACVSIGWTKTRKNGTVLDTFKPVTTNCFDVHYVNTTPNLIEVHVSNTGDGDLLVKASGSFLPGTAVRVGGTILPSSKVAITPDASLLKFRVSAKDIVNAGGISLISRQGDERPLDNAAGKAGSTSLAIKDVTLTPYTDTTDVITINFTPPTGDGLPPEPCAPMTGQPADLQCIATDPYIVTVGSKIYGFADNPFLHTTVPNQIKFLVAPGTSPDRRGEHPREHLRSFSGTLQADAHAGFHHLYEGGGRIHEAACWPHVTQVLRLAGSPCLAARWRNLEAHWGAICDRK